MYSVGTSIQTSNFAVWWLFRKQWLYPSYIFFWLEICLSSLSFSLEFGWGNYGAWRLCWIRAIYGQSICWEGHMAQNSHQCIKKVAGINFILYKLWEVWTCPIALSCLSSQKQEIESREFASWFIWITHCISDLYRCSSHRYMLDALS